MTRYRNPLIAAPAGGLPKRVAVLGAGTIGPDIGYYLKSALPDLELVLVDVDPAPLERARARVDAYVRKGLDRGKLSAALAEKIPLILHDRPSKLIDWPTRASASVAPNFVAARRPSMTSPV